ARSLLFGTGGSRTPGRFATCDSDAGITTVPVAQCWAVAVPSTTEIGADPLGSQPFIYLVRDTTGRLYVTGQQGGVTGGDSRPYSCVQLLNGVAPGLDVRQVAPLDTNTFAGLPELMVLAAQEDTYLVLRLSGTTAMPYTPLFEGPLVLDGTTL